MKILLLDCDSTLSAIEGVDELGRLRGEAVFREVEDMTNAAMNGGLPLEAVFAQRLDIIRPTLAMTRTVADLYYAKRARYLFETLDEVRAAGWTPMIVSGGFRQAILPFAEKLGITRVEAVDLYFDAEGAYTGYDDKALTARSGGKPDVVRALRREFPQSTIVMVGDGSSDLECMGVASLFVGYVGFVARSKVANSGAPLITHFDELPAILKKPFNRA